jgi:predicted nucleotidyltransferase
MRALKQHTPPPKASTEDPELLERFNRVLGQCVEALEESGIRYGFIGGVASWGLGRPRSTHDIDIFVMPEDAEPVLRALAKKGFSTEKTDPSWLYKAWKENVLVDVIFKSKGDIYLDSEMYQRLTTAEFHGRKLRLVAPEDLLIIKATAHSELTPGHWHDAIALLTHAQIDWKYLLSRARRAPRRTLSLLIYAQSVDVFVPNSVIQELYSDIFGGMVGHLVSPREERAARELKAVSSRMPENEDPRGTYGIGHLRDILAEDPRTNALDIRVEKLGHSILLRGDVSGEDRRIAVEQITRENFPSARIENQIRVRPLSDPTEAEDIK